MRFSRPAPATVISCVALFVALGGTGYAVTALPRNSVGSAQLKSHAVKEADVGNRAITSAKLADQSVTRAKLALAAITADRVAGDALTGAQVDEGTLARVPFAAEATRALTAGRTDLATKADQADRATVADSLAALDRNELRFTIADQDVGAVVVPCDAGFQATGGGFELSPGSDVPFVTGSSPEGNGWRLEFADFFAGGDITGTAYAVCAKVVSP